MIRYSNNKIRLENLVVDLTNFQVRRKTIDEDLERLYDSFLEHADEVRDNFVEKRSFDRAVDMVERSRPRLISRELKLPFLYPFHRVGSLDEYLEPSKKRLESKYFMRARTIMCIQGNNKKEDDSMDDRLQQDITYYFEKYPGYECIIEIPNDQTREETKASLFRQSSSYLLARYMVESGRDIAEKLPKTNELYLGRQLVLDNLSGFLADQLLEHDPDSKLEGRWEDYMIGNSYRNIVSGVSAISAGALIGASFFTPYVLPAVVVPGRVRDYLFLKHKNELKGELLSPGYGKKLAHPI